MAQDVAQLANQGFGRVEQSDLTANLHTGIQLAQAHNAHLLNVQRVQMQRQELETKQADWLQHKVATGAAIVNDQARGLYFKQLEVQARKIGLNWDPAVTPIMASKEGALNIQRGQAALMKLPYNSQTQAYLDFKNSLGDPAGAENFLFHGAEIASQQLGMQAQMSYRGREMQMQSSKAFEEAKAKATEQNKDNIERIHYANQILEVVKDPEARKDPYAAAATISGLAKSLFPGGVIRESEVTFLDHINPGMGEKVKAWVQGKLGKGAITEDMFFGIGKLAQHLGANAQNAVDQQKVASQKYLPPGVNAEDVYSTIPKADLGDIRPSFPGMFPSVEPGAQESAQSAAHPDMKPMGPPKSAAQTLPIDQHNRLEAYAQKRGTTADALIAKGGAMAPAAQPAPAQAPESAPLPAEGVAAGSEGEGP